jgi:ribosomal protein S18 acetylase RimI-like enzyme
MDIEIIEAKASEADELVAGVRRFNEQQVGPGNAQPLTVVARGDDGALLGGVSGRTVYGQYLIEVVYVAEACRGTGLGRQLMEIAEAKARARGCVAAQVDTLSFQAPGFYRRLGFEVIGTIEGFPAGHDRHFLFKRYAA